jgi:phage/plasmid-associated DNA primase
MDRKRQKRQTKTSVFKINTYVEANNKFIKDNEIVFDTLEKAVKQLKNDNGYHFRIHKKTQYIFFGDLDNYAYDINTFILSLQTFLKDYYGLQFSTDEFKYTQNNKNANSYHYSISKWNASTEKLKEIHANFQKKCDGKRSIDTTIYSEHWFRCPNQKKGTSENDDSKHVIIVGTMHDFIITNIQDDSVDINDVSFIDVDNTKIVKTDKNTVIVKQDKMVKIKKKPEDAKLKKIIKRPKDIYTDSDTDVDDVTQERSVVLSNKNTSTTVTEYKDTSSAVTEYKNKNIPLTAMMGESTIYKKMFDECYKQDRFEVYEYWMSVGMAIKNTFQDEKIALELFDYYSKKGCNYKGTDEVKKKFLTFVKRKTNDKYTVSTIYYYAISDNKPKCIEIHNKNTFDLEQYDMCNYVKLMAGDRFIYTNSDKIYKLYCFNGKIWINDTVLFKQFLSNELYEFLKMILVELYFDHASFNTMKTQLKRLKSAQFKKDITETYKEVNTNTQIKFDTKWYLLGFDDVVYDAQERVFREYQYSDNVSITTGYDWREPSESEINLINKLITEIMPDSEERELYLQILATCLFGLCVEHFVVFNGHGRNGKGMIDDLLLVALGNYAMIGNNSVLFETNKTGSNPEKANMHKKRLVLFREPPEHRKFENSIIKELTGGGTFSSRGHHESITQKELNLTMIIECNKRPLFCEEPTTADIERIIDVYFRSTYVQDDSLIDHKNHIYSANPYYKTHEFQQQHKYALIKILIDAYKRHKNNKFKIPESIKNRTKTYLELSCNIVQWFKDSYHYTGEKTDVNKMKDLYEQFATSDYFVNFTKAEKRKYNKTYFSNYIQNNTFFKNYYHARIAGLKNCIIQWKINDDDNGNNDNDENYH